MGHTFDCQKDESQNHEGHRILILNLILDLSVPIPAFPSTLVLC